MRADLDERWQWKDYDCAPGERVITTMPSSVYLLQMRDLDLAERIVRDHNAQIEEGERYQAREASNLPAILESAAKLPEFPGPDECKGPPPAAGPWRDSAKEPPPKLRAIWGWWSKIEPLGARVSWSAISECWELTGTVFAVNYDPSFWAEINPPKASEMK